MMDIDPAQLEVALVYPRIGNDVVTTRDTQFHVDIKFSFDLVVSEYYDNIRLGHTVQPGFMTKSVSMDIEQLMDTEISRGMIARELGGWPLDDRNRGRLSEFALMVARNLTRFMPPEHNVLVIPLRVSVECNRHIRIELMAEESEEESDSEMVPATDSSIKDLEMKTISLQENEEESCSICLEDFYTGCEVIKMPCSHIFHEDCIKKWLKSSHYCPTCRFEMPTGSAV